MRTYLICTVHESRRRNALLGLIYFLIKISVANYILVSTAIVNIFMVKALVVVEGVQ